VKENQYAGFTDMLLVRCCTNSSVVTHVNTLRTGDADLRF